MRKIFSVALFVLVIFILPNISRAATPTTPLANITVYRFCANMGYEIDTSRVAGRTSDGFPIFATGLPDSPLMQSNEFANTLILTNKSGDKILSVKLFFQAGGSLNGTVAVLSKVTKALDENIFNTMTANWVAEEMREFLQSVQFNSEDKLIGLESMNYLYKYSRSVKNGVLTIEISAEPQ